MVRALADLGSVSRVLRLVPRHASFVFVLQPLAVAADTHDVGMMKQSIQQRSRERGVVG